MFGFSLQSWVRKLRQANQIHRSGSRGQIHPSERKPVARRWARPIRLEVLEDRTLLSGYTIQQALTAYDTAVTSINQISTATAIINQKLGLNLPLINQTLDRALSLGQDLLTPFKTSLNQNAPDWNSVVTQLQQAGFTNPVPFTGTPDAHGSLFEIDWTRTWNLPSVPLLVNGSTGFDYLDGSGGNIFGAVNGTGKVTVSLTMGVDVNAQNQLGFFLVPVLNSVQATLSGSTAANGLNGTIAIGDLANVKATATGTVSITAGLGFQASPTETDGKVRASDLTGNLGQVVNGGINGNVQLNATFAAQLSNLPDINWSGILSKDVQNSAVQPATVNLDKPSASSLLSSVGAKLFDLGSGIPILGPLSNAINSPLPVIHKSIAQLAGLDKWLPTLPSLPPDFSSLNGPHPLAGGTLTINVTPTTIDQFVHGQNVTLISWEASGDHSFLDYDDTYPLIALGIPDIISAEIDATVGAHITLHWDVGFGMDTRGFWLRAGDSNHPNVGLTFEVTGGLQGQVEVFGFPLAEAGGNIGLQVTPYVTLTAPPWAADPTKVYMSDLALFGSNPFTDFLDATSVGIQGGFTGEVYAKVDLFLFSVSWDWGVNIPVFNYQRKPSWPAQSSGPAGVAATAWPNLKQNGGVLTFDGTSEGDNLSLSQDGTGAVIVNWTGHGSETFNGISQFVFNGSSGNETLTADSSFYIPIRAVGGSGNNIFKGGAGNNTLIAGTGNDSLVGGAGIDLISGGSGKDTLVSGSGTASIFGGSGNSTIYGGSGNASIYAGSGNDLILGGSGTYFIDGGTGSDTINAGTGINDSIYGGTGGNNLITGSSGGYNLIYGGGANDTLSGGSGGNDTIYGSAGGSPGVVTNNRIYGGALGNNLLFGGGSGDVLYGMTGNNTLYGGTGNETLYGGNGQGLQFNATGYALQNAAGDGGSKGNNLLVAGPGNDLIFGDSTGHNTLQGGEGNDTLYAGTGGDQLNAGNGTNALYGGPGNDTLRLPFTLTGQQQPANIVVGGPGINTLALRPPQTTALPNPSDPIVAGHPQLPTPGNYKIYFTQVAGANNQFQATLSNLDTGAAIGQAAFTLPPDVSNVVLEGGPGNNWIQIDASVTRNMYLYGGPGNNTLMAGSGNDTLVAGPGSSVLYGGTGSDMLYGGDLPSQDIQPQLDAYGQVTTRQNPTEGHNTLIAGSGDSELFAGSGGDVLIGGSVARQIGANGTPGLAIMQNGQYQLIAGAGRDILVGGAGTDLLIAGPGGPGAVLEAGTGNAILVADNSGSNVLKGGSGDTNLLIGGNLNNVIIAGSGRDTLVGGLGLNTLIAGSGNDVLYASSNAAAWSQAEAAAAAVHVHLVPPNLFQGDSLATQLAALLTLQQTRPLTTAEQTQLQNLLGQEFTDLATQENLLNNQIIQLLKTPGLSAEQKQQLQTLENQDQAIQQALTTLLGQLGANVFVNSMIGGSGNDQFYGNSNAATYMGGGSGNDTFYNYNPADTILGGGGTDTLMFQGDGAITLTQNASNPQAVDVAIPGQKNGQPYVVGNVGHITGIKVIGVQTGAGNDSVSVANLQAAGLNLYVQCGSGNNIVDASANTTSETLLGGSGNTIFKIGANLATGSIIQAGTGTNELDIADTNSNPVTVSAGGLTIGAPVNLGNFASFQKLVVIGGAGNNVFTTDGSIPNVILQGGSGTNNLSVTGGTATLIGGNGANNSFKVTGPGNYTIIGGTPVSTAAAQPSSGVSAPLPSGMSQTTISLLPTGQYPGWTSVGTMAIYAGGFAGGPSNAVRIYNASTGQQSSATISQARENIAAVSVGAMAIFAGGDANGVTSNAVDIYNASTGQWSTATLSQARFDMNVTSVGTKAIFAGGYKNTNFAASAISNAVDIYDSSTEQWSSTTLSQGRSFMTVTTVGTKAIFAGGESTAGLSSNVVDIYDARTGQWSSTTLSQPIDGSTATTVGTKAIFAGGYVSHGNASNVANIYDASTGQWTTATLSQGRVNIAATTVGTKAIFAGGYNNFTGMRSNALDIYDITTDHWSTVTLSQEGSNIAAATVGTKAFFAGGYRRNGGTNIVDIYDDSTGQWSTATLSQIVSTMFVATFGTKILFSDGDVFTVPPLVTVNTPTIPLSGNAAITYTLVDGASSPSSIQVQYSVNGGPWQVATAAAGGDGTTNLATSVLGTAHTFIWDTAHDLGNTNNPSVQVRITPSGSIGTGVTQASGSFMVDNAGVVNALTIAFTDSNNDTVNLVQNGSSITISGTMAGTATNMTSVSVIGGSGRNKLDASQMVMPMTLNGGTGSNPSTLIGGAGSDTLYYSGTGSTYDGGGGVNNTIVYAANQGDNIAVAAPALVVNGIPKNLSSVSRIENFRVSGSPSSVNNSNQLIWPLDDIPLTNAVINSLTVASGSSVTVLSASFNDADLNTSAGTFTATIDWGDGTTSSGPVAASGGGAFTVSGSHTFSSFGNYVISVIIIDAGGTATSVNGGYTGGVKLETNGTLNNYRGSTPTLLDSSVKSYLFRAADSTVFSLHTDGSLWGIPASGTKQEIDPAVQTIQLGPDGNVYALKGSSLYSIAPSASAQWNLHFVESNVQSIVASSNGNLFKLYTGGSLLRPALIKTP